MEDFEALREGGDELVLVLENQDSVAVLEQQGTAHQSKNKHKKKSAQSKFSDCTKSDLLHFYLPSYCGLPNIYCVFCRC